MIRVLIVEAEESAQNLLRGVVSWEAFQMEIIGAADNGERALSMIPALLPDLVVTDIVMPVMDGLLLAEKISVRYPEIRVIIVTAHDDVRLAQKALRAGVADYILKPLKRQEMEEALLRVKRRFFAGGAGEGPAGAAGSRVSRRALCGQRTFSFHSS